MWKRIREDFQLGIITLFGACGALLVAPFCVYRFASGQPLIGAVDAAIVLCISFAVLSAWRSGKVGLACGVVVFTNNVGCLAAIQLQPVALPWMYAGLLANYFLVPRKWAVLLSAAAIAILATYDHVFTSRLQLFIFVSSSALVSLLAYIFATRTEAQRRQLELLATLDALTGAHNRRAMEQELARAAAHDAAGDADRRQAGHGPVSLAILDLDHFKRINDRAGHEAGDRVLQAFADLVRRNTRMTDRFFRFGGEEFVLLLPGIDATDLAGVCEKLRERVACELRQGGEPVTVSIGAAALHPGERWQDWLARADAALYRAKEGGRDRVEVDAGDPAFQAPIAVERSAHEPRGMHETTGAAG